MRATDPERRPPFVLVDAPEELPAATDELRQNGWTVRDGLELPERSWDVSGLRLVCRLAIQSAGDAEAALLAAARGAGLVVAVADEAHRERLFADLERLGAVRLWHRPGDPLAALDAEQRRLLELLAAGSTLGEAAQALSYSRRTVNRRLAAIRNALGVRTTAEALAYLRQKLE